MIPSYREQFNRNFTEVGYRKFMGMIHARAGVPIKFRLNETPVFLPASLLDRLVDAGRNLTHQLLDNQEYRRAADEAVPERFRLPHGEHRPAFLQVDFGLLMTPSGLEGRLVELQAFASLYGFQLALSESYMETWNITGLTPFLGGIDRETYVETCRRVFVGNHDPAQVVVMEIDPLHQKTLPDFAMTEQLWGVRAVDVREVVREGRRLFYRRDGVLTPIARVYNRVIPDELDHSTLHMPFDYRDDLDVEWLGGPDWFFRISKFGIPWLRHPWVPETHYLDTLDKLPDDRERWLLKPLFSFAGGGIIFAPTDEQIAAIPQAERRHYILQERIAFTPMIETPHGMTQTEVRIMFILDGDRYQPLIPLLRTGRGKMMGVDYNKGLAWVGATAGLMDSSQ